MPLSPRPLQPADHETSEGPQGFREWSRHVGGPVADAGQPRSRYEAPAAVDLAHPLLKVAAAAFIGYTLGRLIHGGAAKAESPAPPQPRPRPGPTATGRSRPGDERRSSVRFR